MGDNSNVKNPLIYEQMQSYFPLSVICNPIDSANIGTPPPRSSKMLIRIKEKKIT